MKRSTLFEASVVILLILLSFMMLVMVTTGPDDAGHWTVPGMVRSVDPGDARSNMFVEGGVLYTIDGKSVHAIDRNGNVAWNATIPDHLGYGGQWDGVMAAADGRALYVIVAPEGRNGGELVAVSTRGQLLWSMALDGDAGDSDVLATNGSVYLYHAGTETILDMMGNVRWQMNGVHKKPAMDSAGNLFLITGPGIKAVEARCPDGTLLWHHDLSEFGVDVTNAGGPMVNLPIYYDHRIYIWTDNDVLALNDDGSLKWAKHLTGPYVNVGWMPFDSDGSLYVGRVVVKFGWPDYNGSYVMIIDKNGNDRLSNDTNYLKYVLTSKVASGGIAYDMDMNLSSGDIGRYPDHGAIENALHQGDQTLAGPASLDDLDTYTISAYDIKTARHIWSYTLPLNRTSAVLTESNVDGLLYRSDADGVRGDNVVAPDEWYKSRDIWPGTKAIGSRSNINILPADGVVYVSFWAYDYEIPTFYGVSKCVYSGGLYALDRNGRLIWEKPTGSFVSSMQQVNGTIYYGTNDGNISAASVDLAAGAIAAAAYVFFRFFMAGAVSRARGRLDKNENRNMVLKFIVGHPGASLYEIARGVKMNIGTVRYHLLILGVNHRITSFSDESKYIRYFTNTNALGKDEQQMISLVRREPLRKILSELLERPGVSNLELSRTLDISESTVCNSLRELSEKGIVVKGPSAYGRQGYAVKGDHREQVSGSIARLSRE